MLKWRDFLCLIYESVCQMLITLLQTAQKLSQIFFNFCKTFIPKNNHSKKQLLFYDVIHTINDITSIIMTFHIQYNNFLSFHYFSIQKQCTNFKQLQTNTYLLSHFKKMHPIQFTNQYSFYFHFFVMQ